MIKFTDDVTFDGTEKEIEVQWQLNGKIRFKAKTFLEFKNLWILTRQLGLQNFVSQSEVVEQIEIMSAKEVK